MRYLKQIFIGIDCLFNAVTGGYGCESFSARCYRLEAEGSYFWHIMRATVDGIFFFQKNHCRESWQYELDIESLKKEEKIYEL
jgi:hypothetical protein